MTQQPTLFPLPEPDFYITLGTVGTVRNRVSDRSALCWGTLIEWVKAYLRLDSRRDGEAYREIQAHLASDVLIRASPTAHRSRNRSGHLARNLADRRQKQASPRPACQAPHHHAGDVA